MIVRHFPSKVLLLGEYSVLCQGIALAVPFNKFSGQWQMDPTLPTTAPGNVEYLKYENQKLHNPLPIETFAEMERSGWRFLSNIPWGKGLGSSAALTASIYKSFTSENDLNIAQADMALMESYFHGKSSGFDALVSYAGSPIYFHVDLGAKPVSLPMAGDRIYIMDSKIERSTGPLVQGFYRMLEQRNFASQIEILKSLSLNCAEKLMRGHSFLPLMKEISAHQIDLFDHMIPPSIKRIWRSVLSDDHLAMKLCGAGGGGFFLIASSPALDVREDHRFASYPIYELDNLTTG